MQNKVLAIIRIKENMIRFRLLRKYPDSLS